LVMAAPGGADVALALDDGELAPGAAQASADGEARGPGADDQGAGRHAGESGTTARGGTTVAQRWHSAVPRPCAAVAGEKSRACGRHARCSYAPHGPANRPAAPDAERRVAH